MAVELGSTHLGSDANLVGYWKLENTTDSSSSGYTLTNNGSTTFDAAQFNLGATFDSTSKYLTKTSPTNLEISGSLTISCWMKTSVTTDGFPVDQTAGVTGGWALFVGYTAQYGFRVSGLSPTNDVHGGTVTTGVWHHMCGVYNSSTNHQSLWVDGAIVAEQDVTGSNATADNVFTIGRRGDATDSFTGLVDDVAVFSRALTDAEVLTLYYGFSSSVSPSLSPSASLSPSSSSSASRSPSASASASASKSTSASPSEGYTGYTRGNYTTLPANDADLETNYSAQDIIDVSTNDAIRVGQVGTSEFMVHQFKNFVGANNECILTWDGQSDLASTASTVYLQIYNRNTTTWDTIDSDATAGANTDFILTTTVMDLTNYKDAGNVISCRVYQLTT